MSVSFKYIYTHINIYEYYSSKIWEHLSNLHSQRILSTFLDPGGIWIKQHFSPEWISMTAMTTHTYF